MDNLDAVANLVTDSDLVSILLSGLSPEYDPFVTSVNTRVDPALSEELISLMLSQEIYRRRAITSPDSTTLISPSPAFILFPALQATIQLHLFSVVVDMAEAVSVVVVVDVPSFRHISPPVADLNARSAIVLAIMLTNAIIVMMFRLAQLLFSTLMGIVQSIPTSMLTPEPLITYS